LRERLHTLHQAVVAGKETRDFARRDTMEISTGQVVVAFVKLASSLQCFGGAVDGKAVSNKTRSFPLEEGEEIWPPPPASNFRVPMRNALALVVAPNCGHPSSCQGGGAMT
jgi:hypothetical protein